MASKTSIANMALSHLGVGLSISNLETERSQTADAIRVFYDVALDMLLRKKDWSFARKTAPFGLVGQDTSGQWAYVFRYPSDCLMVRSLSNHTSYPYGYSVPFKLSSDEQGGLVYANDELGIFNYTYRNQAIEFYPPDFVLALSYLIAFMVAPRVTAGDPFKLGQAAYQLYLTTAEQAAVNSYNEEGPMRQADSAFQIARNA